MGSKGISKQLRIGQILIQGGGKRQFVPGAVRILKGIPLKKALADIKKKAVPYLDYYVFEDRNNDPDKPQNDRIFVVTADASAYDRAKGDTSKFKLFAPNALGSLTRLRGAKFVGMVDKTWKYPLREVDAYVDLPRGRKPTPAQQKLIKSFNALLKKKVGKENASVPLIRAAIHEVLTKIGELSVGVGRIDIDTIKDPEGKAGAKAVKVRVKLIPAPTAIQIVGVPAAQQKKLFAFLEKEMNAILKKHPIISTQNLAGIFGIDRAYALVRSATPKGIGWSYPSGIPTPGNAAANAVRGFFGNKDVKLVPDPAPGRRMPIPRGLLQKLKKRLIKYLKTAPGINRVSTWQIKPDGTLRIAVSHQDHPNFFISRDVAAAIKKETGVDLAAERRILARGTKRWSSRQREAFFKRMEKKFHAAGRELLMHQKGFFHMVSPTTVAILPYNTELVKPAKVTFSGDIKLPSIGGAARLKKLLGNRPMTQAELRKRLEKVEDHYHKAGYLILGENPYNKKGLQLAVVPSSKDGSLEVVVRIVRMGKVHIEGNIPERSKAAFAKALKRYRGKPLRPKKFMRTMGRAMVRLQLKLERRPVFFMRPDGVMEMLVTVETPRNGGFLKVSSDGKTLIGSAGVNLAHSIPGLTSMSMGAWGGGNQNGGSHIYVKTLPLNDDGIFITAGLSYSHGKYWYRKKPDRPEESGIASAGSGSATVHVPVGGEGIASPFEIFFGIQSQIVKRKGQTALGINKSAGLRPATDPCTGAKTDPRRVDKTTYYVGSHVGAGSIHKSVLAKDDTLQGRLSVGVDHNATERKGDMTIKGSLNYSVPLGKYFKLLASASAAVRLPLYGGKLPSERYFSEWDIPLIDFGRSYGDPYNSKYFWYSSVFVALTMNKYAQPMLGATVSSTSSGGVKGGVGVAVLIPLIGFTFYLGTDHRGRPSWGFGAGGATEL